MVALNLGHHFVDPAWTMGTVKALGEERGAQVGDVGVGGEPGALQVAEGGAPYGGRVGPGVSRM